MYLQFDVDGITFFDVGVRSLAGTFESFSFKFRSAIFEYEKCGTRSLYNFFDFSFRTYNVTYIFDSYLIKIFSLNDNGSPG